MTNEQKETMRKTIVLNVKQGDKQIRREYYSVYGLAEQLPGRGKNGHASIATVRQLHKENMPGSFDYCGMKLLPVERLEDVIKWLETRKRVAPASPSRRYLL